MVTPAASCANSEVDRWLLPGIIAGVPSSLKDPALASMLDREGPTNDPLPDVNKRAPAPRTFTKRVRNLAVVIVPPRLARLG
jgi:hypothetical protein